MPLNIPIIPKIADKLSGAGIGRLNQVNNNPTTKPKIRLRKIE